MIQAVLLMVGALTGTGLVVGGVMALVVVAWTDERAEAVLLIVNGYYLLASLMPLALWFALYALHDKANYVTVFDSRWRALFATLQGAFVGSMLGAGPLFLAVVVNVAANLAGFDVGELGAAVRDEIVWSRLLIVVSATIASAFPLGLWVNFAGAGRRDG